MKDIPMFTTPFGVASLLLKEIPYRETAYIHLRSVQPGQLEPLLEECASFCRMAGAERIYAAGDPGLEMYPMHSAVYEMRGEAVVDRSCLENLFPVIDATVSRWRGIYNEKMAAVDNAGTLTAWDEKQILESGGAYFVHHEGHLLGIGWLDDTRILAIAGMKAGDGSRVLNTLLSMVEGAMVTLDVASTNRRAIGLYEKFGFVRTAEKSRWYQIR